jgi:HK97 family phage major capsid protein
MKEEELRVITDQIQSVVEELHKKTETQNAEIKTYGEVTAETKASIDKINTALTTFMQAKADYEKRIDDLELKLQRQTIPGANGAGGPADEAKEFQKKAFYKYLREGRAALDPAEKKALVEDATGQYLVTEELDSEIVRELPKITVMRQLCAVRTIGKDRMKMRSLGGVTVGWGKLETGAGITETDMTPGAPTYQYVEDLYGLAKIGEDELADADFNLESVLAQEFARALGEEEEKQFVVGDGHDYEEPEGITKNATLIANTVTSSASGAVTIEKFLEMLYQCPAQFRKNGAFMVNSNTELLLRQLRAKTGEAVYEGAFLWQPSVQAGLPNTFLGKPIYTQDDIASIASTAAQVFAIFGDFKTGYRIIDRMGMSVQRLTELYAESGLVGFKIHKRVTGGVLRASQQPLVLMTEA